MMQHLLVTCLGGDGCLLLLIDGVGGCSQMIVGGGWALVVLGPLQLPTDH